MANELAVADRVAGAAGNPTTVDVQLTLAHDRVDRVREALAQSPLIYPEVQRILARDIAIDVKLYLASNAAVSDPLALETLLKDRSGLVREALIASHWTQLTLAALGEESTPTVLATVAKLSRTPDQLRDLIAHENDLVAAEARKNSYAPRETVGILEAGGR